MTKSVNPTGSAPDGHQAQQAGADKAAPIWLHARQIRLQPHIRRGNFLSGRWGVRLERGLRPHDRLPSSTNLAIFLAKLGVFSFTGSKCAPSPLLHARSIVCKRVLPMPSQLDLSELIHPRISVPHLAGLSN